MTKKERIAALEDEVQELRRLVTHPRRLLNYKDAATYLGIGVRSVQLLAADGQVLKVQIGHRVLFDIADLDAYIERIKASS